MAALGSATQWPLFHNLIRVVAQQSLFPFACILTLQGLTPADTKSSTSSRTHGPYWVQCLARADLVVALLERRLAVGGGGVVVVVVAM